MKYGKAYNYWRDTLTYFSGKPTNAERNTFERHLERDPFSAEAYEGFSHLTDDELLLDLKEIDVGILSRSAKSPFIKLAIIVAVIALVGVSSFFYLKNDYNFDSFTSKFRKKGTPETTSTKDNNNLENTASYDSEVEIAKLESLSPEQAGIIDTENKNIEQTSAEKELVAKKNKIAATQVQTTQKRQPAKKDAYEAVKSADISKKGTNKEGITAKSEIIGSSTELSEDDNKADNRISGESLNNDNIKSPDQNKPPVSKLSFDLPNTPAKPKMGAKAFQEYLKKNAVLDINSPNNRKSVRLTVIVSETGAAESVLIRKSGGEIIDNRAKKLIFDSPGWLPAVKDKKLVKDTIDLKITFKKRIVNP